LAAEKESTTESCPKWVTWWFTPCPAIDRAGEACWRDTPMKAGQARMQMSIHAKVVGVRHVAHDSIPGATRKNLEDCSWVSGLPESESSKEHKHAVNAVIPKRMYRKTRAIWLRLDCFKPNLHLGYTFPHWQHQCHIVRRLSPTIRVTSRM